MTLDSRAAEGLQIWGGGATDIVECFCFILHFILFTIRFTYKNDRRAITTLQLEIPVIHKGFFPSEWSPTRHYAVCKFRVPNFWDREVEYI